MNTSFIKVDVNTINPEDDDAEKKQSTANEEPVALGVNGSDSLYAEVRDQHVEKFGSFLQNQAKALRESHQNFTTKGKTRDLTEIHQFVKQIPVRYSRLKNVTIAIFYPIKYFVSNQCVTTVFHSYCRRPITFNNRFSHKIYDP